MSSRITGLQSNPFELLNDPISSSDEELSDIHSHASLEDNEADDDDDDDDDEVNEATENILDSKANSDPFAAVDEDSENYNDVQDELPSNSDEFVVVETETETETEIELEVEYTEYDDELLDEYENLEQERLAKINQEWQESVAQLKQAVNWIVLPLIGKLVGRKCARLVWNFACRKLYGS